MAKRFKVGTEVYYKGKKQTIIKSIVGEQMMNKPVFQNGVHTGYHRKPRKFELDNGVVVIGKYLSLDNNRKTKVKSNWDFSKPMDAQDLGDEWDDYAWTADDF